MLRVLPTQTAIITVEQHRIRTNQGAKPYRHNCTRIQHQCFRKDQPHCSPSSPVIDDIASAVEASKAMALHQLFTLAFALHLEPLPTLDYATVPYIKQADRSSDSLNEPDNLRVGANSKLDPIRTRHLPHSVDTLSFLLNHTRAIDAVQPFSKLISLLDEADDDPEFRNLREFFDARYDHNANLIGADKEPRRRMRSVSRAASTKHSAQRPSHSTEARKPSFAASLGGASGALKLNWLRRNTQSDTTQVHDASDDEDSHSRMSSSPHTANPAPPTAPYIRLSKSRRPSSPSSPASSSSHHRHAEHDSTSLITFRIRLDLHTVGLAPPPPKLRSHRAADNPALGLQRIGSGRSATSSDWRKRRASKSSMSSGGAALKPVASPDSMASFGAVSTAVDADSGSQQAGHSAFSEPTSLSAALESAAATKVKTTPSTETPAHTPGADNHLVSIAEGAVTTSEQLTSPSSSTKPARRPSIMSKLLDLGRKKSFLDRLTPDSHDARSASPAPSQGDDTPESRAGQNALGHHANFRSRLHQHPDLAAASNEEALDLDEDDDEGALRAQMMLKAPHGVGASARRRSSTGSLGRGHVAAKQNLHNLGPVQEDGLLDLTMVSSRSSVGTTFSERAIPEESSGGQASSASKRRSAALKDGGDFLSLFRAASSLGLKSINDSKDVVDDDGNDVTTPGQENVRSLKQKQSHMTDTANSNTPSIRTPQVYPKTSSLPTTPGKSIRSLDLDQSPSPYTAGNPIDASFKLGASLAQKMGQEQEAWWPCGDVDPLPISLASALGEALGWEGIMHLCYGKGSRAAAEGSYTALGKAAALDQANKMQERTVQAWRTGVASAGTSPPRTNENLASLLDLGQGNVLAGSLTQKLNLDPANPAIESTNNASILERLHEKAPPRSTTLPHTNDAAVTAALESKQAADGGMGWSQATLLFGSKVNHSRTWQHWQALFRSIKGWIDEYEKTRVRAGLAREIGVDPPIQQTASEKAADGSEDTITISAPRLVDPTNPDLQVPLFVGSPPAASTEVLKVATDRVDAVMLSKVLGTSLSISPCVLADATNRAHGFRRRAGIPEGLPLGPENEETIDYTWSRKRLSVEHFATALTISCDSALHYFTQLDSSTWPYRSAWELDYLEMCVFKSPLVADRFPPPGDAIVPRSQSYRPADGMPDRSRVCPNPDEAGAWDPDVWRRWLHSIREGDIIVPAIAWQAWWTLISVLNGADRTGRSYDLQVKSLEEPYEALTDLGAVYL